MSAKAYRDKKALPLVEKLKEVVKNLTIKCVKLTEQSKKLTAKADGQQVQISRLTNKVMEQSDTIDGLPGGNEGAVIAYERTLQRAQ